LRDLLVSPATPAPQGLSGKPELKEARDLPDLQESPEMTESREKLGLLDYWETLVRLLPVKQEYKGLPVCKGTPEQQELKVQMAVQDTPVALAEPV
jgi:hypothetical protein